MLYFSTNRIEEAKKLKFSNNTVFTSFPGTLFYNPVSYFPSSIGFLIGKKLDFSIHNTIYLIRFFYLFVFFVLILILYKILYHDFILILLALPMFISISTSGVIDSINNPLLFILFAIFIKFVSDKKSLENNHFKFWFFILFSILFTVKPYLFIIFCFTFFIFISNKKYLYSVFLILSFLLSVFWFYYVSSNVIDTRIENTGVILGIKLFLTDINYHFFVPFLNTIFDIKHSLNYVFSFIGLDCSEKQGVNELINYNGRCYYGMYNFPIIYLYSMFLICLNLIYGYNYEYNKKMVLTILSFFILSLFFILRVSWNSYEIEYIEGIWGRYFLPFFFFVPFLFNRKKNDFIFSFNLISIVIIYIIWFLFFEF